MNSPERHRQSNDDIRLTKQRLGMIESIYIADNRGERMRRIEFANIVVGRGLEGDRYFDGRGSFSKMPGTGRAVTLIAAEAIGAIADEHHIDLSNGKHRRNLVTRGVDLDGLVNKCFTIGGVILIGSRLCAPCKYLERLVAPGLYEAIKTRGGLRADVLRGGRIQTGDAVCLLAQRPLGV
jgi:MOSC domain-containing protein YiiM